MFNLGFSEILIIGTLALLLIGPRQLPEMARVLGRMINEFKKATSDLSGGLLDIKNELQKPMREGLDAITRLEEDLRTNVHDAVMTENQPMPETTKIETESTPGSEKDESKG